MAKKVKEEVDVELNPAIILAVLALLSEKQEEIAELLAGDTESDSESEESEDEEKDESEDEDDDEKEEGEEEDSDSFELPPLVKINKMKMPELKTWAKKVGITSEAIKGADESDLRSLLATVGEIGNKEFDDIDDEAIQNLAEALGVEVSKKASKTLDTLKEYFSVADEDETEKEEDADEESDEKDGNSDDEDEEEEKPAKKGKKKAKDEADEDEEKDESDDEGEKEADEDEEDEEEVDAAAVVKKSGKYPKPDVMKSRLLAYNKAAGKKHAIEIGKDPKAAYAELLEKLVGDDGTIAPWGEAYIKNKEGYCCGIALGDAEVKGEDRPVGECAVTGKKFAFDDDSEEFEELE